MGLHCQSEAVCGNNDESLDTPTLKVICTVTRRTLASRYHNVAQELIHDAVQEAACKFYEQSSLRAQVTPRIAYTWILTTATRELSHTLRYESRFVLLPELDEQSDYVVSTASSRVHVERFGAVASRESLTDILTYHALLGKLSGALAEAVQLHSEGYTAGEIAQRVGCTEAAAYKRVQRGCTVLQQLWREEEFGVACGVA